MNRHRRAERTTAALPALLALGLMLGLAAAPGAAADQGVRIGVGRIEIRERLTPGRSYHLPGLEVSNPGTIAGAYQMVAAVVSGQEEAPLDPGWVTFEPGGFSLSPGERRVVSVALAIPATIAPGTYGGLLKAQLAGTGEGVAVGVAAAARLSFTTDRPAEPLEALAFTLRTALDAAAPWPALALGALVVGLLARRVLRHWSVRIERR